MWKLWCGQGRTGRTIFCENVGNDVCETCGFRCVIVYCADHNNARNTARRGLPLRLARYQYAICYAQYCYIFVHVIRSSSPVRPETKCNVQYRHIRVCCTYYTGPIPYAICYAQLLYSIPAKSHIVRFQRHAQQRRLDTCTCMYICHVDTCICDTCIVTCMYIHVDATSPAMLRVSITGGPGVVAVHLPLVGLATDMITTDQNDARHIAGWTWWLSSSPSSSSRTPFIWQRKLYYIILYIIYIYIISPAGWTWWLSSSPSSNSRTPACSPGWSSSCGPAASSASSAASSRSRRWSGCRVVLYYII